MVRMVGKQSQTVIFSSLIVITLLAAGCQSSIDSSESEAVLSTSEQVLGFAALSAVEELRDVLSASVVEDTNGNHEKIHSRLYVANTFLSDVGGLHVDVQSGSLQGYDKTMIISYSDMNKNIDTHEFHYNETIIEVEDDEKESSISGVIIVNGVEYILKGIKEEEDDEYEYDLIAFLDDENYITIKYEVEKGSQSEIEKEFEYERFVDKQLVYRMEIEFEAERDGEREINIKFLDGDLESEYGFKSEWENGRENIKIEYKISEAGVIIEEREFFSYDELNG